MGLFSKSTEPEFEYVDVNVHFAFEQVLEDEEGRVYLAASDIAALLDKAAQATEDAGVNSAQVIRRFVDGLREGLNALR